MKLFKKYTEGDKILFSILKDIEKNSIYYTKLPGNAYLYNANENWWSYIRVTSDSLTIRKKNAKTKDKNLHYPISVNVSEKFNKIYETF